MHRSVRLVVGAGACAALLSACALGGGEPAEEATAAPDEVVQLDYLSMAYQDSTVTAVETMVEQWNADHPETQVNLAFGSWDSSLDQLVTSFQAGDAPDIIHNEAGNMVSFSRQGYLADLAPLLSEETTSAVPDAVWDSVTVDGQITGVPLMMQTYVVYANTTAFEEAGIEVPTGEEMPWDDFQQLATDLTTEDRYGLGWGLRQPAATMMNMAMGFGGTWFEVGDEGAAEITVTEAELEVPTRILEMKEAGAIDPITLTQGGSDTLPGFLGGDYAMVVGGNFLAEQLSAGAPEDFEWTVLPALAGSAGPVQAANPQTLSVAAESEHPDRAAQFLEYAMAPENLSAMAAGDWMIPTTEAALTESVAARTDVPQWEPLLATGSGLAGAPFTQVTNYAQWKDQYATPLFQQFLAGSLSVEELQTRLVEGWESLG